MTDFPGLAIHGKGHTTRLKWHRLLRHLGDPLFSREVMAEGFALGASMELDLRVRADGGFAVLHDAGLEGETSGRGPVRETLPADLRGLCMKDGGHALTLSEDLAAMLQSAHPQALLQFDMKDDLAEIGERGVAHLAEYFRDAGPQIVVSASDLDLVLAVKDRLPSLRRGIDPTDKLEDIRRHRGLKAVEAELVADLDGPTEPDTVYLAWRLVLRAAEGGLDLIGLCHDHGKRVDAWTYNLANPEAGFDEAEWREFSTLMALKPDQITTDEAPATERAWTRRLAEAPRGCDLREVAAARPRPL